MEKMSLNKKEMKVFLFRFFSFYFLIGLPFVLGAEISDLKDKGKAGLVSYNLASSVNHLVDIEPINKDRTVNVVVEIPAGTTQKWEISKTDGSIKREVLKGKPRTIDYIGYPGNYGIVPMTLLPKYRGGDGDPVDVLLLGPSAERGNVVSGKVIGRLNLIDHGEIDHKLIAVLSNSPLYVVDSLAELDQKFPGISKIIETWFANYKGYGKVKTNGFSGVKESMIMLQESVVEFKKESLLKERPNLQYE